MDPVTHLSSGIMGALAARRWFPEAKYLIPLCMLAAWIPDGDILLGNGDPEFNLIYHRGISTSFFGGIFLALGVAGLFKLVSRRTSFLKATLLAYFLVCTHIWLDLITTYGTQILAPFSNHRFALDGAFIIDPVFTGIVLIFFLLAFLLKKWRHEIGLLGMAWFFIYPLSNMAMGAHLESVYAQQLEADGIPYSDIHVTPDALSPRFWKVVTTSGPDYLLDTIDLFSDEKPYPMGRYRRADNGELKALGKQESMFATYAWFAKWPHISEEALPDGKKLIFGDLRFWSTNPVLARLFKERVKNPPFTLTAYLDQEGNLIRWKFVKGASSFGEELER
ncbi:metal-dependent hydrolase [Pseudodesulfovibrio sp.]|nr:metal-dependent hydrolase [Pseudodesulfovibrio sp.]